MTEADRLVYARGFLLTQRQPTGLPSHWRQTQIGACGFYFDPITPVATANDVLLFGHAIDLEGGTSDIQRIVHQVASANDYDRQDIIDRLAGRFLLVRSVGERLLLQQDAVGLRAVYYTDAQYDFAAGSHLDLIAKHIGSPAGYFTGDYLSRNGMQAYPGRATPKLGIVRLLPNTELDSETRRLRRVFPRAPIEPCTAEEAANALVTAVEIQLAAIPAGRPLLASLSAGLDSRVTLALLRDFADRTTFFTYDLSYRAHNEGNRHDKETALALVKKFGLRHTMLDITAPVSDKTFLALMAKNTTFSHSRAVAKAYLDHLPADGLHLRSNAYEIGRGSYRKRGFSPAKVTASSMRYIVANGKSFDPAALDAFEEYRNMTRFDDAVAHGYDGLDILYWEHHMGSWMTPILHESDIAHDTHILVNNRTVLTKLLGVPLEDRVSGRAFRHVVFNRWPELADVPVNGEMLRPA